MHLVGFTIEIYHDARPYERQNQNLIFNFGVGDNRTIDSNCYIAVTIGIPTGSHIYLKCKYCIDTGVGKLRTSDRLGKRFVYCGD
jgi:hypothetical protein